MKIFHAGEMAHGSARAAAATLGRPAAKHSQVASAKSTRPDAASRLVRAPTGDAATAGRQCGERAVASDGEGFQPPLLAAAVIEGTETRVATAPSHAAAGSAR
jgi:hypothetical protein